LSATIRTRLAMALAALVVFALPVWLVFERDPALPPAHAAEPPRQPGPDNQQQKSPPPQKADNGMCYVCHLGLKTEEITTVHLAEGCGCTKCHGPSNDHMHDEMLMTTPDRLYGRREVDAMCGECHEDSHQDVEPEVAAFLQKWRGRDRPNGRAISEQSICTDCHGTHNIDTELKSPAEPPAEFVPLFNGRDLAGWKSSGKADWKIKLGRIVATPGTDGGDLWSEAQYEDYLMAITFRVEMPVHAGIWLRATDAARGPRLEIFKHAKPAAFTGSVGLPGKGLILINFREDLFDPGAWNTLSVEVRARRVAVWLNGEEIGAVCCDVPAKGRIGLHIKGGPGYENAELTVRELQVRKLPAQQQEATAEGP